MPVIKKCEECGKIFNVVPSRAGTARFCSRECRNKNQQTESDIICDNCGKIFHRRQYHIDRQANREEHNFCYIECRSEYKHKTVQNNELVKYVVSCLIVKRFLNRDFALQLVDMYGILL